MGIPRYLSTLERTRKTEAIASMGKIREIALVWYANEGVYPTVAAGGILSVDMDGDGTPEAEIKLIVTSRFAYSIVGGRTGKIKAATPRGKIAYQMDIETGRVSP